MFNNKKYEIKISNFVCDAPAWAFVKGVKAHNAYTGCEKCTMYDMHDGNMYYPQTYCPLRTDVAFEDQIDEEHHTAPNALAGLGLGMVTQFPLDYMHLVCLGVMKRLLSLWMSDPLCTRLGPQSKCTITERLTSMQKFIPK